MRTIHRTTRFRRDFNRLKRGPHADHIDRTLSAALTMLAADKPLPPNFRDHPMRGAFNDCRDCHLRGDLVLVYRKRSDDSLELVRIGSHSMLEL